MNSLLSSSLVDRLRVEGKRLRSADRLACCSLFEKELQTPLTEAVHTSLQGNDAEQALTLLVAASPFFRATQQLPQGVSWLSQALQLPSVAEVPRPLLLRAHLALGQCLIASGDHEAALRPLRRALATSDALKDRRASLVVSNALASACDQLGRTVEAQVLYQNAIEIAEQLSSEDDQCMLHVSLSASYLIAGRFSQAATAARRALSFVHSSADNLALAALNLATALVALGDPDAVPAVHAACDATEGIGNPTLILGARLHKALVEPDPLVARREAIKTLTELKSAGGVLPPVVEQLLRRRDLMF